MSNKILFLLKERTVYSEGYYAGMSSGLYNSARLVAEMLRRKGVHVDFEQVIDANCIDKWVTKHRPDTVIIEALWVFPDKFKELTRLHPNVKWIIRLHSEIPFLSNEGIAIEWLKAYEEYANVFIAANSHYTIEALEQILTRCILYFPNYYPVKNEEVNIGCFGAIRPMKNQLIQALAAIKYADDQCQKLRFHINSSRSEQRGENVLRNIRAVFAGTRHELVEHNWLDHDEFIALVKQMDCGLQVSFSETYNIVAADFVHNYIPIVTSDEITFVAKSCHASTKDVSDIANRIRFAIQARPWVTATNKRLLEKNSEEAECAITGLLDIKKNSEESLFGYWSTQSSKL